MDLESIHVTDGKAMVTTLSTYAHPMGDAKISAALVKIEYDCSGDVFRTIEYTYYSTTKDVLGTEPSETIDKWNAPTEGSIDDAMLKFACTRTGGTKIDDPFADGYFGQQ